MKGLKNCLYVVLILIILLSRSPFTSAENIADDKTYSCFRTGDLANDSNTSVINSFTTTPFITTTGGPGFDDDDE